MQIEEEAASVIAKEAEEIKNEPSSRRAITLANKQLYNKAIKSIGNNGWTSLVSNPHRNDHSWTALEHCPAPRD